MKRKILVVASMVMLLLIMMAAEVGAEEVLLSQGKRVWANSEESANPAANLVDGSLDNNWAALDSGYDKEFTIDLGAVYNLSEMVLYPKNSRAYEYKIYISDDGSDVSNLVVDKSDNTVGSESYTDELNGYQARYVRVEILGEANNGWVSFYEAEIYGDDEQIGKINCALGKNVINVSSEQTDEGNLAEYLTDGTVTKYWAAEGNGQSATIDLGEPFYISSTEIIPEASRAYGYTIEASYNGKDYAEIISCSAGDVENGAICDEFKKVEARYVRLTITSLPSGVSWVNIKEFSIYGEKMGEDISFETGEGLSFIEEADGISVSFTGVSGAIAGRVMTIIVASFDGDKMTGYKAETFEIPSYGEAISCEMYVSDEELGGIEGKSIEAFIWDDLGNMRCQCSTVVYGG